MKPLKILVGMETSGKIRDAAIRAGHDAVSCDLLDTLAPGPHYTGNVLDIIGQDWDAFIGHPECTYVCGSGLHWNKRVPGRADKTEAAIQFWKDLGQATAHIPKTVLENPVGCISTRVRPASQYIQPYQFGHDASKKTGLWLKGLPLLVPTAYYPPRIVASGPYAGKQRWSNQTDSGQNKLGPSQDRWQVRSETYSGIAEAIISQYFTKATQGQQLLAL